MSKHYIPLALVLLAWAVLTLFVFIRTPKVNMALKVLVIPLVVVAAIYSYQVTNLLAGHAKDVKRLPVKFTYVAHSVVLNERFQKVGLEVWTKYHGHTIAYAIPWSEKMEKALEQAQQMRKGSKHGEVEMKLDGEQRSGQKGSDEEQIEDTFKPQLRMPFEDQPKRAEDFPT
jgi:hypothetical protein